jgi:hypothetical protein
MPLDLDWRNHDMGENRQTVPVFRELYEVTDDMTSAQFGELMRAYFEYAETGSPYMGEDPVVGMAFRFAAKQLDRYFDTYEVRAASSRENGRKGGRPPKKAEPQPQPEEVPELELEPQDNTEPECTQDETQQVSQVSEKNLKTQQVSQVSEKNLKTQQVSQVSEKTQKTLLSNPSPIQSNPSPIHRSTVKAHNAPFRPPTVAEVRAYCQERGNSVDPEHFVDHYTANGWSVGKNKMRDWKAAVRNWEKNQYSAQSPPGTTPGVSCPDDLQWALNGVKRMREELKGD